MPPANATENTATTRRMRTMGLRVIYAFSPGGKRKRPCEQGRHVYFDNAERGQKRTRRRGDEVRSIYQVVGRSARLRALEDRYVRAETARLAERRCVGGTRFQDEPASRGR